jgi:NADH:ubiquinone oxidoreductase subunit 6 (subunit J)
VVLAATEWPEAVGQRGASGTADLARLLFSEYVLPLEIVSVLLLAAVIGGIFVAKREEQPEQSIVARPPVGQERELDT